MGDENMYEIKIENCNNIVQGKISIVENKLNIKYGINGTGKTTISRAIQYSKENQLQDLKSYFSKEPAKITMVPAFSNVLVFDEEFVNQVVFKEDEVIENSFEIFLKTPYYDIKKHHLDEHLYSLKKIMEEDVEITELKENLNKVNSKFKRTSTGKISNTGAMKSLLSKQNLYNIPEELSDYKPFFNNTDIAQGVSLITRKGYNEKDLRISL
ncbi:MAG: AAA family ATPase [Eubacterium sp.]|nr:AAA family ATPase [Eubacterium sp.]